MQTIYFRDHRTSGNDAYDLYRLMSDLDSKKDVKIVFDKDTYQIDPDYCFEKCVNISNHGWNGYKRFFALLDGMENIELDFSGSTLISGGVLTPFGILNSKNITVKNAVLENPNTQFLQAKIIAHGDGYVDLEKMHGASQFSLRHDRELVTNYYQCFFVVTNSVEYNCNTGEIEPGTGDHSFGYLWDMRFEDIGDNKLRLHGVKRYPPIGNIAVFSAARRLGCGFFCEDSSDITLENITIHSCYGMGILAQTCHNIHLNSFNTLRHGDQFYTANADSTHFVNCTGLVLVENSTFEGQLDDALNIHGMYARIESKSKREILVREVHVEAKGIRIYREGDKIQVVNNQSLIPYTEKTIAKAEYVNQDILRLVLNEDTDDIVIGDDIESLDRAADLIFRNNTVRNNRARGMLIATRGKTVIENCYFHTSGSAILFESNGDFWFESGGVQDVTIKNNFFDGCKYTIWGKAVISCVPRKAVEEGKYFNKSIKILDNKFHMTMDYAAELNNIEHAVFKGNEITSADGVSPKITLTHIGDADIETDIRIEKED